MQKKLPNKRDFSI